MSVRPRRLELIALGGILLLALAHLPYPFGGDQALFTVGAQELAQGAVLYRDFWDFKQPGIFWFYWLAGRLFGFDEVGVHTLELLYLLALAVVLLLTLRARFRSPFVLALVPLLVVGHYYLVSDWWHLTQVEGLVGFPLYLTAWLTSGPDGPAPRWRLVLGGVTGGAALVFKLMFAPIVLAFVLTAVLERRRVSAERLGRTLAQVLLPIAGGLLLSVGAVVGFCAWTGGLDEALWTWFAFPLEVVRELPPPQLWRLFSGLDWFLHGFASLAALAVLGAAADGRRRDPLVRDLVWWCALGLVVILVQAQSWWAYHYHLLGLPLGVLAAFGLDEAWSRGTRARVFADSRRAKAALLAGLLLCLLPSATLMVRKFGYLLKEDLAWRPEARARYRAAVSEPYATAARDASFLAEPGSVPGPIFVFGDPLYYVVSGRRQAIPLNGWFMEMAPAAQWREVARQLGDARPPYVFVAAIEAALIRQHSDELSALLASAYRELRRSPAGIWYIRTTARSGENRAAAR
jgi:hypothetical protein